MGWAVVRGTYSDIIVELRFRHNPNLFNDNVYQLYDMIWGIGVPKTIALMATPATNRGSGLQLTCTYSNPLIGIGSEITIQGVYGHPLCRWRGTQVNGKGQLWLKEIPDNIR